MRPSDNLFLLIKSLSKSEKREFKLLATRYKNSSARIAYRLFDIMDKLPEFDESKIISKLNITNAASLYPPIKFYLSNLIMRILRNAISYNSSQMLLIQLIQDAYIYEERGLNSLLLKTLKKALHLSLEKEDNLISAILTEFDCRIKLDHDVKVNKDFLPKRIHLENNIIASLEIETKLRHLFYNLWVQYKLNRNSKSPNFILFIQEIHNDLLAFNFQNLRGFKSIWYFLRIHSLLANIEENRIEGLRYCQEMIDLFDLHPRYKNNLFPSYRSALVNYLVASHRLHLYDTFPGVLKRLYEIEGNSEREKALLFSDITFYEILYLINTKQYEKIFREIPNIETALAKYKQLLPPTRVLSFYNNIAIASFLCLDYENAHIYVNKIITFGIVLRTDILRSVSFLEILIHFELGNNTVVFYKLRNLLRELKTREVSLELEQMTSKYLKQIISSVGNRNKRRLFKDFAEAVENRYKANPHNAPVFCDELILWLQTKFL